MDVPAANLDVQCRPPPFYHSAVLSGAALDAAVQPRRRGQAAAFLLDGTKPLFHPQELTCIQSPFPLQLCQKPVGRVRARPVVGALCLQLSHIQFKGPKSLLGVGTSNDAGLGALAVFESSSQCFDLEFKALDAVRFPAAVDRGPVLDVTSPLGVVECV